MIKPMRNLIIFLFSITLIACGKNFKIDKKDFEIVPYQGNEILIFESDKHDRDTIFLLGIENYSTPFGPMELFPDKHEIYRVKTKRTDPNYDRYLEGKSLIELVAGEGGTSIWFDIAMKRSWYYGKYVFNKSEFEKIPLTELNINGSNYNDVKIIESDGSYEERDNYAERFYWSVKNGFLGLDRRDEKWRLIKKYVP
jgi:hypothetical protein